jgi:threonine aldolase
MFFASDNSGPVHPKIMQALMDANQGYAMPYGNDLIMEEVRAQIRELFEAPEAAVYLVATGTAANCLGLATRARSWDTIFCSPTAHIHEDECNGPEFTTGGAKLTLVGRDDKMTPDALRAAIKAEEVRGVHGPQRGPVSITQVTERGQVYSLPELRALTVVAQEFGLPVHLDGARFSNALVSLGCSPADMTWKSGVDILSFGGTKNGCMGVEAVVIFDPATAWDFELLRKRGGHLFSKHRYLSAQMAAYLRDDLWREMAGKANAAAARLSQGIAALPDGTLEFPAHANMIFARWPRAQHITAHEAGAAYYLYPGDKTLDGPLDEPLLARLVCSWCTNEADVDAFLAKITP